MQPSPETPSPVPHDLIPLSSMEFVGPLPPVTPMSNVRKDGPWVISVTTPSPEELRVITYDVTPSLHESLDQGIPLPPFPQYPKWYLPHTPQSPSPNSSNGITTDSWETSTQMTSPPRSPSSSPQKRGAGSSSKSRRQSPYTQQVCVPRDPSQNLQMEAKSLLHWQVEESGDIHLVIAIWKLVLGDHDVLGCRDCVCHLVTMKWSYCSLCYHPEYPHHLCLRTVVASLTGKTSCTS